MDIGQPSPTFTTSLNVARNLLDWAKVCCPDKNSWPVEHIHHTSKWRSARANTCILLLRFYSLLGKNRTPTAAGDVHLLDYWSCPMPTWFVGSLLSKMLREFTCILILIYMYIYICVCVHKCMYIYIYIYCIQIWILYPGLSWAAYWVSMGDPQNGWFRATSPARSAA